LLLLLLSPSWKPTGLLPSITNNTVDCIVIIQVTCRKAHAK
jgi:hypothetical protein